MSSTQADSVKNRTYSGANNLVGISLHAYPTTFQHESRILKETSALGTSGMFNHVWIAGLGAEGLPAIQPIDVARTLERFDLIASRLPRFLANLIKLPEWYLRVFNRFRKQNVTVVSCHSLSSLPLGLLFKIICGSKLVYETHELETQRNGWSALTVKVAAIVEQLMFRFVDHTVTVGDSIGMWYRAKYRTDKVTVVKNVPLRTNLPAKDPQYFRSSFNIESDATVFLYQGVLSQGRSIELLIELFKQMPQSKQLVLMGYGPLSNTVKEAAAAHKNIHYHPAVPPDELLTYTPAADVGLALFENTSLSYFYSAPNKLFEYLVCGVPMLVSDFPDMAEVIDRHSCGWKVPLNRTAIDELLRSISPEEIQQRKHNALTASRQVKWETEAENLLSVYRGVTSN
jgi:glycosyltransferase involved in cell wall biosynthesis